MQHKTPFEKNYSRIASARQFFLNTASYQTLLSFDAKTGESWQAWVFNNGVLGTNGIGLVKFSLNGGYSTEGEINITVGPESGDLVTGTGPCTVGVNVRGGAGTDISVWFTPEQTVRALPPFARFETNLAAAGFNYGFPPFGRYRCQILSPANYTARLIDNAGNIVFTGVFTPQTFFDDSQAFLHPPDLQLEIIPSAPPQRCKVTHYE